KLRHAAGAACWWASACGGLGSGRMLGADGRNLLLAPRRVVLILVAPAMVAVALCTTGTVGATAARSPSVAVFARLRTLTWFFAKQNRESHPTDLRMVATKSI